MRRHQVETASIPRKTWSDLEVSAKAFRLVHASIALVELTCLGHIWLCALTRRRSRLLAVSMAVLSAQAAGLVIGRGHCPIGPLQRRIGDPVPLFELVLPRRAAKAAVPVLAAVTFASLVALVLLPAREER
jgi:hypothetical protein